jgi:hypothetical protein
LLAALIGIAGGLLTVFQQWTQPRPVALAALGGATLLYLALVCWRGRAPWLSEGVLKIDAGGSARWQGASDSASRQFEPLQWFAALGLVWLDGRVGGHRCRLLLASAALTAPDRARLHRWMRWLDRGGTSCKSAATPQPQPELR